MDDQQTRIDDHERRIAELERNARQVRSDMSSLSAQNASIMTQISNISANLNSIKSSMSSNSLQQNTLMIEMLERSEKRLDERLSPINEIISGIRWTKKMLIAIASTGATVIVFLATYGDKISQMISHAYHFIMGQ